MPKYGKRTALLIRCSVEEAKAIRAAAQKADRTISSYVLRVLRSRLNIERQAEETQSQFFENYLKRVRGMK
jgi:hypothetical protein